MALARGGNCSSGGIINGTGDDYETGGGCGSIV